MSCDSMRTYSRLTRRQLIHAACQAATATAPAQTTIKTHGRELSAQPSSSHIASGHCKVHRWRAHAGAHAACGVHGAGLGRGAVASGAAGGWAAAQCGASGGSGADLAGRGDSCKAGPG
ncbi:hypothetical protein HaLaN_03099 [Haematococcus lacustris]|uniref:Uncharacterized protein n=1 Tax=Haematococcus lacustris TaxID=44745 RepID=A0A699YJT2_HAELA|nr:hypothetical protein HaLaN_03099 [Haematococcus lacustris]